MLTAKNKVEEWPYHPNPQYKFTISIVQAEESKVLWLFCHRGLAFVELALLAAASGKTGSNIFRTGRMHVFFANPKPLVRVHRLAANEPTVLPGIEVVFRLRRC